MWEEIIIYNNVEKNNENSNKFHSTEYYFAAYLDLDFKRIVSNCPTTRCYTKFLKKPRGNCTYKILLTYYYGFMRYLDILTDIFCERCEQEKKLQQWV